MADLEMLKVLSVDEFWDRLRATDDFWHTTKPEAFSMILASGAIKPNLGDREPTYRSSLRSHAHNLKAVSLYDFTNSNEKEMRDRLFDFHPQPIFIRIPRKALDPSRLILPSSMAALPNDKLYVPYLEALHIGPIETKLFSGFACFCVDSDEFLLEDISLGVDAQDQITEILAIHHRWKKSRQPEGHGKFLDDLVKSFDNGETG